MMVSRRLKRRFARKGALLCAALDLRQSARTIQCKIPQKNPKDDEICLIYLLTISTKRIPPGGMRNESSLASITLPSISVT